MEITKETTSSENRSSAKGEQDNKDYILVQSALDGDHDARTKIVLEHQQNVYNLGLRLSGRDDEAECILQETFLKVFEKMENFRGDSKLGTWIHRIATNVALMRIRSRKGKYFVPIDEEPSEEESPKELGFIAKSLDMDPLSLTLNDELRRNLEDAITSLPVNLRTAFVLKDLEGLSMADIAEETGKTVSAIKADLHRARVKLRKKLADFAEGSEK